MNELNIPHNAKPGLKIWRLRVIAASNTSAGDLAESDFKKVFTINDPSKDKFRAIIQYRIDQTKERIRLRCLESTGREKVYSSAVYSRAFRVSLIRKAKTVALEIYQDCKSLYTDMKELFTAKRQGVDAR